MFRFCLVLVGLLTGLSNAASATGADSKRLSGEVSFELQNDWNYKSDDRGNLNNQLAPTIEPSVTLQLAPGWSISAVAVMETLGDPDAKVHIVEFLDPACETCALFYPMVKKWMSEVPGQIRLSVRHVAFHSGAEYAVNAAASRAAMGPARTSSQPSSCLDPATLRTISARGEKPPPRVS